MSVAYVEQELINVCPYTPERHALFTLQIRSNNAKPRHTRWLNIDVQCFREIELALLRNAVRDEVKPS